MSVNASSNFISSFDAMVKQAYQGQMKLKDKVRLKTGVVGSTHRFHTLGAGLANVRTPQTDVVPMAITHGNATATLTDYAAPEYTDVYDLSKLSFDERRELAFVVAGAMGRRIDQIVIDALDDATPDNSVGVDFPSTASGLVLEKILRAKRFLDSVGAPPEDRFLLHNARGLEDALQETELTSNDFAIVKSLVAGELNKFAGFEFVLLDGRSSEGGLPISSNDRTNFAYHRDSVGLAIGIDLKTEVNYVPEKTSWLINGIFSAGAAVIDTAGFVDVVTSEA